MKLLALFILSCCLIVALGAETKCQRKAREARELAKKGVADVSGPSCNADGSYKSKQCMWFGCGCVDENGKYTTKIARGPEISNLQC